MNVPGRTVVLNNPFLDNHGILGRILVDGRPYTAEDLEGLLSGNSPFEASKRYTDELKATVRRCLAYSPEDRRTSEELNAITRKHLEATTSRRGKTRSKPEDRVVIRLPEYLQRFDIGNELLATAPAGGKGKK
ncbi:hypothetical protein IQ06DRAFT_352425 [Phaeosphaeriaceae sp. SRC1lsM3a]|nr:hypothetical protein IQ06DRAFT_352425 [Stagonospora sp. SRC1lsM3a]